MSSPIVEDIELRDGRVETRVDGDSHLLDAFQEADEQASLLVSELHDCLDEGPVHGLHEAPGQGWALSDPHQPLTQEFAACLVREAKEAGLAGQPAFFDRDF